MELAKLQSPNPLLTPSHLLRFSSESTTFHQSFNLGSFSQQPQIDNHSLRIRPQFKISYITRCSFSDSNDLRFDYISSSPSSSKDIEFSRCNAGSSLLRDAAWIGAATFASKTFGLLREVVVAAVFGVGPVATAFKYASVLPGFCTSVVGGVNGPFHVAMATTLSKQSEENARRLFIKTISAAFLIGAIMGAFTFVFAEFIVHISAPGWMCSKRTPTCIK